MVTTVITGRELVAQLLADNTNDWDGSEPAAEIERATYAVVIERDDDAWVRAADTFAEVARLELACRVDTQGYDEWVSEVWNVATGEQVAYTTRVIVALLDTDGTEIARAEDS